MPEQEPGRGDCGEQNERECHPHTGWLPPLRRGRRAGVGLDYPVACRIHLRDKAVALFGQSLNVGNARRVFSQSLANLGNVVVQVAVFDERIRPDRSNEFLAANGPAGIRDKIEKRVEGLGCNGNRRALAIQCASSSVLKIRTKLVHGASFHAVGPALRFSNIFSHAAKDLPALKAVVCLAARAGVPSTLSAIRRFLMAKSEVSGNVLVYRFATVVATALLLLASLVPAAAGTLTITTTQADVPDGTVSL